ncbi:MAG TPA: hypothetical protein VIS74_06605, partial [Chthoniobacterales bacterium]
MNSSILFDLIGAVELTASAAITVALLSIGFGRSWTERARLASALGAWFVLVVVFAATEIFSSRPGSLGVGGVGISVAVPLLILCVAVFRVPSLRSALEKVPLAL